MTGYTLQSGVMTCTVSWYCPVCCQRVYSAPGPLTVRWHVEHYPEQSVITGCVVTRQLCCSPQCVEVYSARVQHAVQQYSGMADRRYLATYSELGVVPDEIVLRMYAAVLRE